MSQIPASQAVLASSVSQGALQQSQVARQRDARRNHGAREAQKLRESAAKHVEQVEDPSEAGESHLTVGEDSGGGNSYQYPQRGNEREDSAEEVREAEAANEAEAAYADDAGEPAPHIDLTG